MSRLSGNLTYANVMATIAIFIALGGASYAALKLPKNSVGTKQIRKESVTAAKVKKGTLTGKQIKESTLGTVPRAETANAASSLPPPENWHLVGVPGAPQPQLFSSWAAVETVAYFRDQEGIVHLTGFVKDGNDRPLFELPDGDRPAAGAHLKVLAACEGGPCGADGASAVEIRGSHMPDLAGFVLAPEGATAVSLAGISFRAES